MTKDYTWDDIAKKENVTSYSLYTEDKIGILVTCIHSDCYNLLLVDYRDPFKEVTSFQGLNRQQLLEKINERARMGDK